MNIKKIDEISSSEIHKIIENVAYLDGSLRDIYIYDTTLEDWDKFLKIIRERYPFKTGDKPLPDTILNIISDECRDCLSIYIADGVIANCHFYVAENFTSPIELDLDPRELLEVEAMRFCLEFMISLGDGLNKDVHITAENMPEATLLIYSPSTQIFTIFED